MAKIDELALYIIRKTGPITEDHLHQLLFYCIAWSLAFDGTPIVPNRAYKHPDGIRIEGLQIPSDVIGYEPIDITEEVAWPN